MTDIEKAREWLAEHGQRIVLDGGDWYGALAADAAHVTAELREEVERLKRENEALWRERTVAVGKVRAWEKTLVVEGLPMREHAIDDWGPGEDERVAVPEVTPKKLTDILDELARLREALK